jgi:hypothetical protein
VNYISLEQYKHKGKCMQRGEENRPGGRWRSCNAVEGLLASQLVSSSGPALSPYFLFVSWVLTSAIFVPLSLLVICTYFSPAAPICRKQNQRPKEQLMRASLAIGKWWTKQRRWICDVLVNWTFFLLCSLALSGFPASLFFLVFLFLFSLLFLSLSPLFCRFYLQKREQPRR